MHDGMVNQKRTPLTLSENEALRCLKRSDLVEALANCLPVGSIRFGCHVGAIGTDPRTSFPIVHLDDGKPIKAKVIIGCDGSNSVVARSLGLEEPKLFPIYGVRGFTNYPNCHIYGNKGFRHRENQMVLGRIPVDEKLVYWFVAWRSSSRDSEVEKVPERIRDTALELVKQFPTDVIEMVRHCDLDSLSLAHIGYRAPWSFPFANLWRGTVTVAGDAMHVMGPFLGQGGSCGLEDAVVLGRCIGQEVNLDEEIDDQEFMKRVASAFRGYVKERRLRVMRLSTQSYLVGSMLATTSMVKRIVCMVILMAFFGGRSHHSRYDCGRL